MKKKRLTKEEYTVGWICALAVPELKASRLLFDGEEHEDVILDHRTLHQYVYGEINGHNVVMGCLPSSQMGKASAAAVANEMSMVFNGLHFTLIVGIGGAVPMPNDIRLGDVVVSLPDLSRQHSGVIQYDFGKAMHNGKFVKTGQLNQPPTTVLSGISKVRSIPEGDASFSRHLDRYSQDSYWDRGPGDRLFSASCGHAEGQQTCSGCDPNYEYVRPQRTTTAPLVHYGLIASGDKVMKDAMRRDALSEQYGGILCFEMEAAGIANIMPCLVIRGICDYCDSHKNKAWQPFAAAAAAAWAKELLGNIAPISSQGHALAHREDQLKTAADSWLERFVGQLTTAKRSVDDIRDMIERMSSYEPRKILKRISRKKLPGTTEWLTGSPAFVDWKSDHAMSSILWLSVGSGKTVAMTTAVHHLLATVQSHPKTNIIHHFFQYPETKAIDLFRSLSRQLLQLHMEHREYCSIELANDLDIHFGARNRSPDLDEIIGDILVPLTHAFDTLNVCVDGIDMCDGHEQNHIWAGLQKLSEQRATRQKRTRTLLTSGNESELATLLPANTLRIRVDQGSISDDIEAYIDIRLQERARPRQLFHDTKLRARVKGALLQRAENMFLWVHLQLEEIIHNCANPSQVESTLQDLPKSLHDLYTRCLRRQSSGKLLCNPKVLKWCSAARKPLCVDSLRDMLAFNQESGDVELNKKPDSESVIRSGVSLLTLEEPEMLLEPAHHSVRQFIFSRLLCDSLANDDYFPLAMQDQLHMSLYDSEVEIGQLCLRHIHATTRIEIEVHRTIKAPSVVGMIPPFIQTTLRLGQRKTEAPKFPRIAMQRTMKPHTTAFLQYAIDNWLLHTVNFEETTPCWDKFEYVALQPNASWKLHPWPAVGNTRNSHIRGLLGYAVTHNHRPLLRLLAKSPTLLPRRVYDEVLPGNELLPALHVAAKFGHGGLMTMLLKLCSINCRCPQHLRTALHIAIAHGQDEFATALCGVPNVDLDKPDADGLTPIALALRNTQIATVRALLTSLRVDTRSESNGLTDDERYACGVLEDIFLKHRPVDLEDQNGNTHLHNAAEMGDETTTKLLLASKADANAKGSKDGKTPLHQAASYGHSAIVKLLLANQADANAKENESGSTPLHNAASSGHDAVVKLLLASQADVNAKKSDGSTPLHKAAGSGHDTIVKLLLDTGRAEVDLTDWEGRTPLNYAASKGHEGIVGWLLATGKVVVNLRDTNMGNTPLHEAAFGRHDAVVKLLVNEGKAHVDLGTGPGPVKTPYSLVRVGDYEKLRRLLREDADRH